MNRQWVRNFIRYSPNVYGLGQMIKQARDAKRQPQIQTSVLFTIMLAGFVLRTPSMEDLQRQIRKGRFQKLLPSRERVSSHDTIRCALRKWDLERLATSHDGMIAKWKQIRGPQKGAVDGLRVAAQRLIRDGVRRHGRLQTSSCSTRSMRKLLSAMNAWITGSTWSSV